jgi:hypothetical protein
MEKETLILKELFIPVLQKDERFEESKCDSLFWNKVTSEFINFEQDKKPFYASIYSLDLVNVEQVLNELELLLNPFLEQLAEENVQGYSSEITKKLAKENDYFKERVLFYNNLKKAIFLSERKRIKSELPSMYEKYTFEINEKQLVEGITKIERQTLRDKMRVWDEELIESKIKFSLAETETKSSYSNDEIIKFLRAETESKSEFNSEIKNDKVKIISLSWIKYAVAACFVFGLGFWFFNNQTDIVTPVNPVVIQPNGGNTKLTAPKPVLEEVITSSKVTDVLIDEGLGFTSSTNQIKVITINNINRILSVQKAIETYQSFIEKELITSKDDGIKNKSLHIEIKKEIEALQIELNSLQTKDDAYLFDGKALTLFDVEQTKIIVLTYGNDYYFKKGSNFYVLTKTNVPRVFTKVKDKTLQTSLEKVLFTNGI